MKLHRSLIRLLSEEFAALAEVTIFNASSTSTSDDVAQMLDRLQIIEKAIEKAILPTKRMMDLPLPEFPLTEPPIMEPPMVEPDRSSAGNAVDEHGTPRCLASWKMACAWLPVRGHIRGAPDCVDGVRNGNLGAGLASPFSFLGAILFRSLNSCRREKPPVLRYIRVRGDPDDFVLGFVSKR